MENRIIVQTGYSYSLYELNKIVRLVTISFLSYFYADRMHCQVRFISVPTCCVTIQLFDPLAASYVSSEHWNRQPYKVKLQLSLLIKFLWTNDMDVGIIPCKMCTCQLHIVLVVWG